MYHSLQILPLSCVKTYIKEAAIFSKTCLCMVDLGVRKMYEICLHYFWVFVNMKGQCLVTEGGRQGIRGHFHWILKRVLKPFFKAPHDQRMYPRDNKVFECWQVDIVQALELSNLLLAKKDMFRLCHRQFKFIYALSYKPRICWTLQFTLCIEFYLFKPWHAKLIIVLIIHIHLNNKLICLLYGHELCF